MWRVIVLAVVQSALLAIGQVFLLINWQFACSGAFFGASSVLWMYIVKHYPLSVAYPMISLSYVFGMLAAIAFFHESVSAVKWIGIGFIMIGCCLIAK